MATPAAILSILVTANSRQAQAELLKVNKQLGVTEDRSHRCARLPAPLGLRSAAPLPWVRRSGFDELRQGAKVTAQTNAVLKSTGGIANVSAKGVDTLANSILKKSGIDDEAVKSGENMLLTFTKVRNETGRGNDIFNQATKAVADMATAMNNGAVPSGQKMAQTSILIGKALNDPIKGVTALRRVGVQLTEGQQEQIKALVKNGETMKAQKIILRELNTEFGGSAAAAGKTLPGQLNILRETFNNLAGSVVQAVIPALQAMVGPMQAVANFFSEHQTTAKILTVTLAALAVTLGAVAVAENVYVTATKIATAAQWALNVALSANPIALVVIALAALAVGIVVAYKKVEPFRKAVQNTFQWIKSTGRCCWASSPAPSVWRRWRSSRTGTRSRPRPSRRWQGVKKAIVDPIHTAVSAVRDAIGSLAGWLSDAGTAWSARRAGSSTASSTSSTSCRS
jgi:hypothetical protein